MMSLYLKREISEVCVVVRAGSASAVRASLLNVYSVFAVLTLLYLEPELPIGCYLHEAVFQPD